MSCIVRTQRPLLPLKAVSAAVNVCVFCKNIVSLIFVSAEEAMEWGMKWIWNEYYI